MNSPTSPPDDLGARLEKAEAILNALEHREADALLCKDGPLLLRRKEQVEQERRAKRELEKRVDETTLELAIARGAIDTEKSYHALVSTLREGIVLQAREAAILAWNPAAEKILGLSGTQMKGLTSLDPSWKTIHEDGTPFPLEKHPGSEVMLTGIPQTNVVMGIQKPDGTLTWILINAVPIVDSENTVPSSVVMSFTDITERKRAEEQRRLAANVFNHAGEGIMITDSEGIILDVNESFTRITGYGRMEVLGKNRKFLQRGRHSAEFYAAISGELVRNGYWSGETWNRRKNGEVFAEMQTVSAVRDDQGKTVQYVFLLSDITPLKEHERQLEHMAHFDALTNLPNRVLLAEQLRRAMAQALRHNRKLAVVYLDLDGFKAINDRYGHDAGDQLLIELATRMKEAMRDEDTLARIGGDEFVAILTDLAEIGISAETYYARLIATVARPIEIGNIELQVSASVGVTFYPQADPIDADQLLRQADQAMYQAKLSGKNRFHIFDAEQDRSVRGHHENLERIKQALAQHEFVLLYQPKVNMRTGEVVGAEALIRWQHPEKGMLPPSAFLSEIEAHALSIEMGDWVIDTALAQIEIWLAAGLEIPISVNISAQHLQQQNFKDRLAALLALHPQVNPGLLQLEVLETSALADMTRVSGMMNDCLDIGVSFALDDFGTGYSSLTYLKRLPAVTLKIDQSFVRHMLDDSEYLTIIEAALGLAIAFRRQIIAEGVESIEQGKLLIQLGCELAQGYQIARPMPAIQLLGWIQDWRSNPAWANVSVVSYNERPLLSAGVEHRAWVTGVELFLKGEHRKRPTMDAYQCGLMRWLEVERQNINGSPDFLNGIEALHVQAYAKAQELLDIQASGADAEALARLGELRDLSNTLLVELGSLQLKESKERPPSSSRR